MKKVAVILSGCGVFDGAEIHESVFTLAALDRAGAEVTIAAPDIAQHHVVNHQTGEVAEDETRQVMAESARIARGPVKPVSELDPADFDALVLPGGFGAAKNLSSFAFAGAECSIDSAVADTLLKFHAAGKVIGLSCIAPNLAAKVFGKDGVRLTIGNDKSTAVALEALGAKHVECPVDDCVVDENLRIVTTPAYMYDARISEIETGISRWIEKVLEMA